MKKIRDHIRGVRGHLSSPMFCDCSETSGPGIFDSNAHPEQEYESPARMLSAHAALSEQACRAVFDTEGGSGVGSGGVGGMSFKSLQMDPHKPGPPYVVDADGIREMDPRERVTYPNPSKFKLR